MSGPTVLNGIVKQVNSGDCIIVRDVPRGGPPTETIIYLANVSAPKLAKRPNPNSNDITSKDEAYAWEAREFLRKKIVGETVTYVKEKSNQSNRDCYFVYLGKDTANEENINETLIKEGYVTVRPPGSPLRELEEQSKSAGKGKHNKNLNEEDHIRDIKWSLTSTQMQELVDKYQGKRVKAIVEHVRDGSTVRCFIQDEKTFYYLTIMLSGIRCPGYKMENGRPGAPEEYTEEAKYFVESRLLNRDVEITLDTVNGNNIVGNVLHPKGNIAEFLLQEGFAKCSDWTMKFVKNPETFRKCERIGKEKQQRLWKGWQPPVQQLTGIEKEFQATVVEVGNGDALTVKLPNGESKKVFLASIRPPRLAGSEENKEVPVRRANRLYEIPWMFEAREFLRKKLIGKKVNVVVDYVQPPKDGFQEKTCCTVTIAGANVAEAMVLKGLATVVKHRPDDPRSSHYDNLTSAELKAVKNQKGLHSKKEVSILRINDYSSDSNKAKNMFPHLKRNGRVEGLVEFVFSGSRLRLLIAKDSCLITLLLAGISCPRAPRQSPMGNVPAEGEPYGEEALQFTREKCFQREVEITYEGHDKAGNYIGWLWVENVNLSVALVQEGLSRVHEFSAERSDFHRQLQEAQSSAKLNKLNIWKNFVEEDEKDKHKEEDEIITERKVNHQKVVIIEVTDELFVYAQSEEQCPKLESLMSKMRAELANVTTGAYTPKKGDLCAAKFCYDDQWYRAKVEKVIGNKVKVLYVDYGNRDEISSTLCAALPAGYTADPPFAHQYALAFVKFGGDTEDREAAITELREDLLNRSVLLNVEYKANGVGYVTLYDPENDKIDFVKNIVEDGFLLVENRKERRLHKVVDEYKKAQENALKGRKALWRYGDITEDDDKEFGLGR